MMRSYRYLFFIIYSRWYKKDRNSSLAVFSALAELSLYAEINLGSILLNLSLWFGAYMPGTGATRNELLIGVIPMMIVLFLIHYFLLVYGGRRQAILDEFKDVPKKDLTPLKLYIALYILVSLILLIGLPWLQDALYDHWK